MKEKIAWVFENIQKLAGVPITENNIFILGISLSKLKEVYQELETMEEKDHGDNAADP